MLAPLIPWHTFFKRLKRQKSENLEMWLCLWLFNDTGALLLERQKNHQRPLLSLEERLLPAEFLAPARGLRSRFWN
jgi:hypothetical protein